jgi:hypothetical protein
MFGGGYKKKKILKLAREYARVRELGGKPTTVR